MSRNVMVERARQPIQAAGHRTAAGPYALELAAHLGGRLLGAFDEFRQVRFQS